MPPYAPGCQRMTQHHSGQEKGRKPCIYLDLRPVSDCFGLLDGAGGGTANAYVLAGGAYSSTHMTTHKTKRLRCSRPYPPRHRTGTPRHGTASLAVGAACSEGAGASRCVHHYAILPRQRPSVYDVVISIDASGMTAASACSMTLPNWTHRTL